MIKFLRKKLDCKETDSVFCYVNSVFAPSLDEGVGGLWRVSCVGAVVLESALFFILLMRLIDVLDDTIVL